MHLLFEDKISWRYSQPTLAIFPGKGLKSSVRAGILRNSQRHCAALIFTVANKTVSQFLSKLIIDKNVYKNIVFWPPGTVMRETKKKLLKGTSTEIHREQFHIVLNPACIFHDLGSSLFYLIIQAIVEILPFSIKVWKHKRNRSHQLLIAIHFHVTSSCLFVHI